MDLGFAFALHGIGMNWSIKGSIKAADGQSCFGNILIVIQSSLRTRLVPYGSALGQKESHAGKHLVLESASQAEQRYLVCL